MKVCRDINDNNFDVIKARELLDVDFDDDVPIISPHSAAEIAAELGGLVAAAERGEVGWTQLFYRFCKGQGIAGGGARAERLVREHCHEQVAQQKQRALASQFLNIDGPRRDAEHRRRLQALSGLPAGASAGRAHRVPWAQSLPVFIPALHVH
jgi:hypothetical protein